ERDTHFTEVIVSCRRRPPVAAKVSQGSQIQHPSMSEIPAAFAEKDPPVTDPFAVKLFPFSCRELVCLDAGGMIEECGINRFCIEPVQGGGGDTDIHIPGQFREGVIKRALEVLSLDPGES